jgi:hypothetical protein
MQIVLMTTRRPDAKHLNSRSDHILWVLVVAGKCTCKLGSSRGDGFCYWKRDSRRFIVLVTETPVSAEQNFSWSYDRRMSMGKIQALSAC